MKRSTGASAAWVYAALLATFGVLAAVFIGFAGRLGQAGISRSVYFLVLVPVGLGSAAFLDRMLQASKAEWVAKFWFGRFRLAGATAVFGLVVAAGIYTTATSPPLQVVVRVFDAGGPVTRGKVLLYAGRNVWTKEISSEGVAAFGEISESLRGQQVRLAADVPGFEPVDGSPLSIPADGVLQLSLRRAAPPVTVIAGTVLTQDARPLPGAWVDLEHGLARVRTDEAGHFRAELPRPPGATVLLMVVFDGKVGHQGYYTVPNELTLRFER